MDAGSLLITLLTVVLVGVTTWYAFQTHRMSDAAVESVKVAKEATRSAAESAALADRTAQILDEQLTFEALPVGFDLAHPRRTGDIAHSR